MVRQGDQRNLYIRPLNQSSCRFVLKDAFSRNARCAGKDPLFTLENDDEFPVGLGRSADVKDLPKHPVPAERRRGIQEIKRARIMSTCKPRQR